MEMIASVLLDHTIVFLRQLEVDEAASDSRVQLLRRTGFHAYANFVIFHIIFSEQAEAAEVKKANESEAFPMRRRNSNMALSTAQHLPAFFVKGQRIVSTGLNSHAFSKRT